MKSSLFPVDSCHDIPGSHYGSAQKPSDRLAVYHVQQSKFLFSVCTHNSQVHRLFPESCSCIVSTQDKIQHLQHIQDDILKIIMEQDISSKHRSFYGRHHAQHDHSYNQKGKKHENAINHISGETHPEPGVLCLFITVIVLHSTSAPRFPSLPRSPLAPVPLTWG